jgi:hypothetical protein
MPLRYRQSHITQALGHSDFRAGYDVLFTTQSNMLNQLQAAHHYPSSHGAFEMLLDGKSYRAPQGPKTPKPTTLKSEKSNTEKRR